MKSAVLVSAILAGLSAAAMADPMTRQTRNIVILPADDQPASMVMDWDVDFHQAPFPDLFKIEEQPGGFVATDLDSDGSTNDKGFAIDENSSSAPIRMPEPPPLTTITLGLSSLGILGLCRQRRKYRRLAHRRRSVYPVIEER